MNTPTLLKWPIAFLVIFFAIIANFEAISQTSVGINTTTPNKNAVLELVSPNNNQGFLVPRLSSTQRISLTGSLTLADNGLLVFDSDSTTFYYWNGKVSSWQRVSSGSVPTLNQVLLSDNSANTSIINLSNPVNPQDAVTKIYVDGAILTLTTTLQTDITNINNALKKDSTSISKINTNLVIDSTNISKLQKNITNLVSNPRVYLPTGDIFVGDINDTSRATNPNTVSISIFGKATANVDINTHKLVNLAEPTSNQDAATKYYVDSLRSTIVSGVSKFNGRTGAVTLTGADVKTALGYTPYDSTNPKGYISANQTITFTPSGDVTGSASGATSLTPTLSIGANKVTNAQLAQMPANTLKGNNTAGAANASDLTVAQVQTMLGMVNLSGTNITGTLPVVNGGTGATTLTGYIKGNGINPFTASNTVPWSDVSATPTTLGGYGITDAYPLTGNPSGFLTSFSETDPIWTAASSNYYTKTNLQTNGQSQVHFGNITNKPTTLAGYGITDGVDTSRKINTAAPLSGGGDLTADRTLSISQATNTTDGYLSSVDWNKFNNKQSALTFSTGLTNNAGTVTVNTSQNINTLSNLTTNGLIKTSGGTGALSIATSGAGKDYLAPNSAIVGATNTKITYDANGLVTAGTNATLASADFANQGTTTGLLHGNAAGNPSWGPIVNGDIANGTIDLTSKVTNVLPIANGGTNNATLAVTNGGVLYTDGSKIVNLGVGTSGQFLQTQGVGATPVWASPSGNVSTFSAGLLNPLFTTSVTNPNTTPALSFTLSNAGAYSIFGNNTAGVATPIFFTPALASALFQNQGTTSTVLHGNAGGNPSWGQIANADLDKTNIPLSGFGAATANVDMGSKNINNVKDPVALQDAATKNYVDNQNANIEAKLAADSTSISNINNTLVKDSTNISNINNTLIKDSTSISDINKTLIKDSTSISNINNTLIKDSTSISNINKTLIKDSTSISNINNTLIKDSTSISNINNTLIKDSTSISNINNTLIKDSTSISNINNTLIKDSTSLSKITDIIKKGNFVLPTGDIFVGDANDTARATNPDTIPISVFGKATANVNMNTHELVNLAEPTSNQDAATKYYVDSLQSTIVSGVSSFNGNTGAITLTGTDVDNLLGYTPYNSTNPSGYISANQTITFTPSLGDVTGSASGTTSLTPTLSIGANKVTNAQLAQMPTMTIKGNNTGGTANASDLSTAQIQTMLGISGTNSGDVTLAGENYLSIAGQVITANPVGLAGTNVTGTLPLGKGGTGQTTAQAAMNSLAGGVTSGQYLRGNGTNVVLSTIQATDVPTLNQNTTGSAGSVTNAITFNNGGAGAASGATFNGSSAQTISYNTIGAQPAGSYIGLTSLSATAPLTYNNGTGVFAIPVATGAANGYLASADWTTFNSKEPAITTGTNLQYWRGDKSWQTLNTTVVPEGTNLYYTDARAIAAPLAGFSSTTGTITTADNILTAIDKLNGNIAAATAGSVSSITGTANQVITSAATGAVTLSLPQSINTTNSPTFTGLALSGLSTAGIVTNTSGGILGTQTGTGFLKDNGAGTISYDNSTYLTSTTGVTTFSGGSTGLTPSSATSGAISLAGTLAVGYGGTGLTSVTANNLMYGNGASALNLLAPAGTTGELLMNTAAGAPSWSLLTNLPTTAGILPVANGGTGQSTYTNGQLLIGNTTGNTLSKATLTGTTDQIAVTNGAGSITLSLDASATLAGNPTFAANGYGFGTTGLIFEGATADNNEGLLTVADPTADRTWTLPDASGTIALSNNVWLLSGNTGTGGTGIIGTTDNAAMSMRTGTGILGIADDANAQTINFGTGAAAKTINIGSTTVGTGLVERIGTGNYSLDGVAASTYAIGASTVGGTITIGGTGGTGAITLGSSTAGETINIGTGTGANTVNIATNGAGNVTIGKSGSITLPVLATKGIVTNTAAGLLGTQTGTGFLKDNGAGTISYDNSTYLTSTTGVTTFSGGSTGLTPSSATSGAISLAGTLAVGYGGTGLTSVTANNLMYGNGASALNLLAPAGTTGELLMNTAAGAPSWSLLTNLPTTAGILPVANGGTGQSTYTNGQLLIGNTTGNTLSKATLTGTTDQIAVTNGAGSITLSLDASATLAGNPTFAANGYGFGTTGLIFEGATADNNEGLLTVADPTADRTWTLPDASGTIALSNNVWLLSGNTGTGGTGIIGTTDNAAMSMRTGTGILGIADDANAQTINFGTGAAAKTINIGSTTVGTGLVERIGTGNYSLDGVAASTYAIGASTVGGTITIGGTGGTGAITLGSSTAGETINIGTGTGANTVNIATNGAGNVTIGKSGSITLPVLATKGIVTNTAAGLLGTQTGTGFLKDNGAGTISYDNSTYLTSTTGVTTFSGGSTGLTPSSATSGAISLAGTLAVGYGGTGLTSVTANNLMYGNGASALNLLAPAGTTGELLMNTAAGAPSWSLLTNLPTTAGILPVANGGTGQSTYTNGQLLIGNTTGNTLSKATLTGTTDQIAVTNGAGSITLSLDASATLAGNPTFAANGYGFGTTGLIFEGATADNNEGLLTVADPTADRTWTLPDVSGTILTSANGVSSITGTANQITASASTGAVTLSLPATITGLTSVTSTGFTGALTGNATTSTTATNLAGGANGSIPYQTAAGTTTMLAAGTNGQALVLAGGVPTWGNVASLSSLTAKVIPYYNGTGLVNSTGWCDGTNLYLGSTTLPTFTYNLEVNGTFKTGKIYHGSDRRWKKNIVTLDSALTKVLALRGVSYEWRKDEFPNQNFGDGKQIGLIAQEVEKVYPELVNTGKDGFKAVEYDNIVAILIEAVKAQQKLIDQQNAKIETLQADNSKAQVELKKMDDMKAEIESLNKQMASIQNLIKMLNPSASVK